MARPKGRRTLLLELRTLLTLETARFSNINDDVTITDRAGRPVNVDAFIRERTRIWRESWVFPIVDQLLEKEARPEPQPPARPATHVQEYRIKIHGPAGGYVDREGYATLDKSKAYLFGSQSAARIYIHDRYNVVRLGRMTLEEAPKRGK